jgi:hypothetical protein
MPRPTLYEKRVSPLGKVTYRRYDVPNRIIEFELTNKEIATIVSSMGICTLNALTAHLPASAALRRRTTGLQQAIKDMAALAGGTLQERHLAAGTAAYCAAIERLGEELSVAEVVEDDPA